MTKPQPMAGVKVLDIATFLAAPFAGTILADFGATVLKIEHPKLGDPMRAFGTQTECGDTLAWLSEARNKQCMTLDLRHPEGAAVFRQLIAQSDVLLENFRPGTLEKWGLAPDMLREINPKLVVLRVSAYGQTGPKRGLPGFARVAHGFGGLSYLAGEPDGKPVVPGSTSLADYLSGIWGAVGVLMSLRVAERTGIGQDVDIGLYESVFRLLDEIAPAYARNGYRARTHGCRRADGGAAWPLADQRGPLGRHRLHQRQDLRALGRRHGQAGADRCRPACRPRRSASPAVRSATGWWPTGPRA